MNRSVLVLMSTYNGGKNITRQVESILNQKAVETTIMIRDDGSDTPTKDILQSIQKSYPDRVFVNYDSNVGWKRSFINLLSSVDSKFDYYAFSDQDDIWFEEKLINCILKMEQDDYNGIKLAHCKALSVDKDLQKRSEQEDRAAVPPDFKSAIATEYFQGCSMVWNNQAMMKILRHKPNNENLAHDYWVGLICYLFGKVYYIDTPQFYHIRYDENTSADGSRLKGRIQRLKAVFKGNNGYMNPVEDLLEGYLEEIKKDPDLLSFLSDLKCYKQKRKTKYRLLFDKQFVRPSRSASVIFKFNILINKY